MKQMWHGYGMALLLAGSLHAADTKPLYENRFDTAPTGKLPADMLVLDGAFGVAEQGGNKFLELPGDPLESFGVMFGPSEKAGLSATARFHGTGKGRRFPSFSLGLNGVSGFKLRLTPAKKQLELLRGDEVRAAAPFEWESGKWVFLKMQARDVGTGLKVEGRAWMEGKPEPTTWTLTIDEKEPMSAGRPSVWGLPFAGTPIRFDDLIVERATE